jgi:hypothetical protein
VKGPIVTALTAIALALLAFYAGVALEAGRTTRSTLQFPDTLPPITTIGRGGGAHSVWVTDTVVATAQSRTDWLHTLATAGALVGAAFLLARLAIVVVRQIRVRRTA